MKTALVEIRGVAPISFSRNFDDGTNPKREGESHDAYDQRLWRERAHYDKKTREVFIPGIAFKFSLDNVAKQLGLKIQGRGNKTWKSLFESGIICPYPVNLGVKVDDLESIRVYVNADGIRGSSKRVWRTFPILHEWGGMITFFIVNDEINQDIFRRHIEMAGKIDGIGRYRAGRGGLYGRYEITDFVWQDEVAEAA